MDIVISHPFKKRNRMRVKKRLIIEYFGYLLKIRVAIGRGLFKYITCNLSAIKGDSHPATNLNAGVEYLGYCIIKGFFDRQGYCYPETCGRGEGQWSNP
jgi:hypothetical protein